MPEYVHWKSRVRPFSLICCAHLLRLFLQRYRAAVIDHRVETVAIGNGLQEQLQARLETLKREFHAGQARLRDLEQQETALREALLRISGAIQVLEEELGKTDEGPSLTPGRPEGAAGEV